MKKEGLNLLQLNKLLSIWQSRLQLDDWILSIDIVEFTRKDYQQSGDIKINLGEKNAVIQLTNHPFKDEEYVLVHELVHLILWKFDMFCEKSILEKLNELKKKTKRNEYLELLESVVNHITKALLASSGRTNIPDYC